jgi:hypothetical protein
MASKGYFEGAMFVLKEYRTAICSNQFPFFILYCTADIVLNCTAHEVPYQSTVLCSTAYIALFIEIGLRPQQCTKVYCLYCSERMHHCTWISNISSLPALL